LNIPIVVRKAGPLVASAVLRIVGSFEKNLIVHIIAAARHVVLRKLIGPLQFTLLTVTKGVYGVEL